MRTKNNKFINFILEFSQVLLVFLGVLSALMCTITSLELSYDRGLWTLIMFAAAILLYGLFTVLETFHNGKFYGILGITLFLVLVVVRFLPLVKKGVVTIINGFLKEFMNYTGSSHTLLSVDDSTVVSVKFCTTLILIMLGIYLITLVSAFFYRRRRSAVFLVCTIPFVVLPLVVGRLGYFSNLFTYLIVAAAVVGTRHLKTDATDRRMRQKLSIILMLIGLVAGGVSWIIIPPERYERNTGRITQVKNTMVALTTWSTEDIGTWIKAYFNDDAIDYGRIGKKNGVSYTGETMLKLSGDVNENHGLYLKGYVGDIYSKNKWKSLASDEQYQSDLADLTKLGASPDNWHVQLRNELGDSERTGVSDLWQVGTLRIRNLAFGYGNYLVPYLPETTFKQEDNGRATIDTKGIDYTVEYFVTYPYIMRRELLSQNETLASTQFWEGNKAKRDKMKEFAEKYYLDVPDSVSEVCEDFKNYLNDNGSLYDKYQSGTIDKKDILSAVKTYITKDTEYTLTPGKTPSGEDTVEYFLKENKKGYCTYYATSAAVLLRSVGIPTRYVEGMYVTKEELAQGVETGAEIEVKDSDAHAWIEVFDEKYGFVPMEVTPGVGEDDMDESDSSTSDDSGDSSDSTSADSSQQSDDSSDSIDEATPTPSVTQEPEEDMVFDDIDGNEDSSEDGGSDSGLSAGKKVLFILLEILIVLLLAAAFLEAQRRIRTKLFLGNLKHIPVKKRIIRIHHHLTPVFISRGALYRGQSVAEYAAQISMAMRIPEDELYAYTELVYHARFGPDDITDEQAEQFRRIFVKIRDKAYADAKILKKLYYMYIMVL